MIDPAVLPGYLVAVFLVALAPGPDNTYIAAVALARGTRAGLVSAFGMSLGMVAHVSAAGLGLAALLRSRPEAIIALQCFGAAYLGWLAVSTVRSTAHSPSQSRATDDRRLVRRAVLTNLTNPKVILFFAAFLPQFIRSGHGPVVIQLMTLGALFLLVGLVCDCLIGVSAGHLGKAIGSTGRGPRALTIAAGLSFGVLALVLITEALGNATHLP